MTRESWPHDQMVYDSQLFRIPSGKPIGPVFKGDFRLFRGRDGRTVLMKFPLVGGIKSGALLQAEFVDLETGKRLADCVPALDGGDATVGFDGESLVTVGGDAIVLEWDPATGKARRQPWRPNRAVSRDGFSALLEGGRTLAVLCNDHRLRWYDIGTRRQYGVSLPVTASRKRLDLSSDGSSVLLGTQDGTTRLWHLNSLPLLAGPEVWSDFKFQGIAFSPDRQLVFAGTQYQSHARTGFLADAAGRPKGWPVAEATYGPVFSDDGKLLATFSAAVPEQLPFAQVHDAVTGKPVTARLWTRTYIHSLAFTPDNRTLAIGGIGGTYLWDIGQARPKRFLYQEAPVAQLLFSADGSLLATGSRTGWPGEQSSFRLWKVKTGRPVGAVIPTSDAPLFFFSPDGRTLTTLEHRGGLLRRWDTADLRPVAEPILLHEQTLMEQAVFRPDGKRLVSGYSDGSVLQWDPETGKRIGPVMSHPAPVVALDCGPDGRTLAVGCSDGTVRLHDGNGRPISPPMCHRHAVRKLAFTRDGRTLLAAFSDGRSRTYRIPLPHPEAPPETLEAWLQGLSGIAVDGESIVLVDSSTWRKQLDRIPKSWLAAGPHSESARSAWHDRRAHEVEQEGTGIGALWHLDRLIEGQGKVSWLAHARRGRILLATGQLERAAEDYRRAASGGESLITWYRHCSAKAALEKQWPAAQWYLDRLIAASGNEWQPYAQRSFVRLQRGLIEESVADEVAASRLGADRDFFIALGDAHAAACRWAQANGSWTRADALGVLDVDLCQKLMLVRLQIGDQSGYQAVGARLLHAAEEKEPPLAVVPVLARMWSLGPRSVPAWTVPLRLTAKAMAVGKGIGPGFDPDPSTQLALFRHTVLQARAWMLFRAGKYPRTRACLKRILEDGKSSPTVEDWLLLALVEQKLGNEESARTWLAKCQSWLDNPPDDSDWQQRLRIKLVHAEANRSLAKPE